MRTRFAGSRRSVRFVGLLVALTCSTAAIGLARDRVPFRGHIAFDDTPVFSDPDDGAYATDYLAADTQVDVVRRDSDGWLAIRPPAGSFSWVPADRVELTDRGDEAEVIADGTHVWIGSRVESVRDHRWQVSLEVGEFVRVLGRKNLGDGRSSRGGEWIQIAPPHGEFRWIHESKLRETTERRVASVARSRAVKNRARPNDSPVADAADQSAVAVGTSPREMANVADSRARQPGSPGVLPGDSEPLVTRASPQAAPADFAEFPPRQPTDPVGTDFPIEPAQFSRFTRLFRSEPDPAETGRAEPGSAAAVRAESGRSAASLSPSGLPGVAPTRANDAEEGQWREARRRRSSSADAPSEYSAPSDVPAMPNIPGVPTGPDLVGPDPAAARDIGPLPFSPRQTELELEEISLELSAMVARDSSFWNFGPLAARAENLIERAPTPLDRGRARLLYEKIAAFEENRRQFDQATRPSAGPPTSIAGDSSPNSTTSAGGLARLISSTTPGLGNPIGAGPVSSAGGAAAGSAHGAEPRFDGSGWLLPVHSTKQLAPPFALMDDEGRVLQYVTPAPGLNLHRYTRTRIGIYGQKGTFPNLNAPHVTAHRVVTLDRHQR